MNTSFKNPIRRAVRGNFARGRLSSPLRCAAAALEPTPSTTHRLHQFMGTIMMSIMECRIRVGQEVFDATQKYRHFEAVTAAEGWDMKTTCVQRQRDRAMVFIREFQPRDRQN